MSESGSYVESWEVDGIVDRKILHYLRKKQKIHIGMLNNYINYTFIHKIKKNKKIKKKKKKTNKQTNKQTYRSKNKNPRFLLRTLKKLKQKTNVSDRSEEHTSELQSPA